jgi:hypothetical protein
VAVEFGVAAASFADVVLAAAVVAAFVAATKIPPVAAELTPSASMVPHHPENA